MTSMKHADLHPLLQEYGKFMSLDRTTQVNGKAHTCHPIPDGVETYIWFNVVKLWHVEQGHVVHDTLAYYNSDRDALTCPYHLLNVPGPNAEWGVEVIWH